MKKILTFAFAAMAAFALQAADAYFRVDIDGQKDQIVLTPEKDSDYNASRFGWLKDPNAKQYTLSVGFKEAISSAEWKDCSHSSPRNPERSLSRSAVSGQKNRKTAHGFLSINLSSMTNFMPMAISKRPGSIKTVSCR